MKSFDMLEDYFRQFDRVVVAYSGGVDSTLLLKAACDALGDDAVGVIVVSKLIPQDEVDLAFEVAEQFNMNVKAIEVDFSELDEFLHNPADRCYLCKKIIFKKILEFAKEFGAEAVFDGSNIDDATDYRPGTRALKELGVISPYKILKFSKAAIREISHEQDLLTWDMPSKACLASRIPYENDITEKKLNEIDQGEMFLAALGFKINRVRHFGDIAKIEVDKKEVNRLLEPDIFEQVMAKMLEIGFKQVEVDLNGYKSGKLNDGIVNRGDS